jgi:hypothetical protein
MPIEFDDERPLEDWEYPDSDESNDDDGTATVTCAACGSDIYEDAPQCPVCGEYVTSIGGTVWGGRSGWWIALGLLGIIAVIYVFLGL